MIRQLLIGLLLFVFAVDSVSVCAQIPVILRVSAAEQSDTTGCNFVHELTRITYAAIMAGDARLWNSPGKEIVISSSSLREIEKSSGLAFVDQEIVFIYEVWSNSGDLLDMKTTGFLFSGRNANGENVEFGYVESADLNKVLIGERLRANPNGNFNASLSDYLSRKKFNYNFIQFAGKVIDNAADSRRVYEEYLSGKDFAVAAGASGDIPQKLVVYSIDASADNSREKQLNANRVLRAVDGYLRQNEEVIYNFGGDSVIQSSSKDRWKVTKIVVNELWKKPGNALHFDLIGVIFYINNFPLQEIPYREIVAMEDLRIDDELLADFLKAKNFNFTIRRINSADVSRSDAYLYYKALLSSEWNKLSEYVKRQQ